MSAQWWRVTERSGDLVIETSTDGSEFSLRHTLAELRVSFSLRSSALATAKVAAINR